ncbi:MAG: InlB B-repeat-containing protein [Paludibacteraceae bacterium]|nr:InlB B-repeat-containing protein [Paludibacteraceae bacterium]
MKKLFTLFTLVALFASATMAQIKLYVHQNDGSYTEFVAATVDSITFSEQELIVDYANGYQYVDMGLPSGLLWATCNVGAKTSTEFGDYFAWGETETKESYTNKTYKWYEDSDEIVEIKYSDLFKADASGNIRTLLELVDDAANVKLGGNWRMPTREEFEELLHPANTDLCLVSKNDVKGYLVVSKKNGNTLFLPAAGFKLADEVTGVEDEYYYWTSEHAEEGLGVANVVGNFYGSLDVRQFNRPIGCTIRPVLAKTLDYTISFKANGAEGEMTDIDAKYAQTITLPSNEFIKEGYDFICWTTNEDGTGKSYNGGDIITIVNNVVLYAQWKEKVDETIPNNNNHEYVDMGLPSGLLWATCNVGATKPEEHGGDFAWGEVEAKNEETADTYKWQGDTYDKVTKYYDVDNKSVLELADDAANANWGGNWRMPSREEWMELSNTDYCTWDWTTVNDVKGYLVTSKKNGNSIFLPVTGSGYNRDREGYEIENAIYWTNRNECSTWVAEIFAFSSTFIGITNNEHFLPREYALTVRPVLPRSLKQTITFDNNNGSGMMHDIKVDYADFVQIPECTFTNDGFTFIGWNTKADGTGVFYKVGTIFSISKDINLYAMWYNEKTSGTKNTKEYIDLGLPSGTLWATCNVGANSPEEYGDYYSWGETQTKSTFTASNYSYKSNPLTLPLSNDVANIKWGTDWRYPTEEEHQELRNSNYCTWIWAEMNGITGYCIKSKINGNNIFLPAGGRKLNSETRYLGELCSYWTSNLDVEYSEQVYIISYDSPYAGTIWDFEYRDDGRPVRPVLPK